MNSLLIRLQTDITDIIKDDDTSDTTLNKLWQVKYLLDDAIRIEMRNRRLTQLNLTTLKTEVKNFQQRYQLAATNDTSLPVYVETTLMKEYLETSMSKEVFQDTIQSIIELDQFYWMLDAGNCLNIKGSMSRHTQYAKWVTIGDPDEDPDTRETFVSLQRVMSDLYILNTTQPQLSTEFLNHGEQIGTYHYQYALIPSTRQLRRI